MSTTKEGDQQEEQKCYIEDKEIQNVKEFKYLGITIHKRNCNFTPSLIDLRDKATRAIYAITSKVNIKIIPIKKTLKVFDAIIVPILLYGSEVWEPYLNHPIIW